MDSPWSFKLTRLDFLKALGLAGAGAALPGGAAFAKTNDPFRTPGSSNKTMKGAAEQACWAISWEPATWTWRPSATSFRLRSPMPSV
jgi:hypothetical protein